MSLTLQRLTMLVFGGALIFSLAGCNTFTKVGLDGVRCDSSTDCDTGFACEAGYCVVDHDILDVLLQETTLLDIPEDSSLCGMMLCAPDESCCDGVCCMQGAICCNGGCTAIAFDAAHCGACGEACSDNQLCFSSVCACMPGFGDCDQIEATGCEVDLSSSADDCGVCGIPCDTAVAPECTGGTCTCGGTLCGGDEECCILDAGAGPINTCIDTQTSSTHCGGCSTSVAQNWCSAGEACVAGACSCAGADACVSGQRCCPGGCVDGDTCPCGTEICDSTETCCGDYCADLSLNQDDCGACGVACGDAICAAGVCVCEPGLSACAGECVEQLTDTNHCGGCGLVCADSEDCCGGACIAVNTDANHCGGCDVLCDGKCNDGLCDCTNGDKPVDLSGNDQDNCGACGNRCDEHPNTQNIDTSCNAGACIYTCFVGFGDCTSALGCETQTDTSTEHCGVCGGVCAEGTTCVSGECLCGGSASCVASEATHVSAAICNADVCEFTCENGYADCNTNVFDGCEANLLDNSGRDCGACDYNCDGHANTDDAMTVCTNGACDYRCYNDWGDCDGAVLGCETKVKDSEQHCGTCDNACIAGAICNYFECLCDDSYGDVCETTLPNVSAASCGTPTKADVCVLVCEPGFGDCDGNSANGCEQDLSTNPNHCGFCDSSCPDNYCVGGECHCGSDTGDVCASEDPMVSASCDGTTCNIACQKDATDADGSAANGCEACDGLICAFGTQCELPDKVCECDKVSCTADIADRCENHTCLCGHTPACTSGQTCINGTCQ